MKIQVLGSGCPSCKSLYQQVSDIAKTLNPNLEVEYSTDIIKIAELGAMSSPVLAIDNEIIFAGKIPSEEELKEAISKKLNS